MDEVKNCILCNKPTTGSVGAAGIKWSMICQPCKDKEDDALKNRIKHTAMIIDKLEKVCL